MTDRRSQRNVIAAMEVAERTMSKAILSRLSARGYDDLGQASLSIIPLLGGSESMPADWSGRTGLSRKVLRRAINLLIDRGYVEQVSDPDRISAPHLRLTSRGIALGKACREVDIELQTLAAAALGPDGVKRLRRQLDGLRASLSAQASDGERMPIAPKRISGTAQVGPPAITRSNARRRPPRATPGMIARCRSSSACRGMADGDRRHFLDGFLDRRTGRGTGAALSLRAA